jgi:hypothetical protein
MLLKLWKYVLLLSIPILFYLFISIYYLNNYVNFNIIPSFATYLQYLIIAVIFSFAVIVLYSVIYKKYCLYLFLVSVFLFIIGHFLFKVLLIKKWKHEYPNSTFKNPTKTEIKITYNPNY